MCGYLLIQRVFFCRPDGRIPGPNARLCSCHFKYGDKSKGPSIFRWVNMTMVYQYPKVANIKNDTYALYARKKISSKGKLPRELDL